jgi:ADP-dependent NAD(P)H-hydrate dehydratase / NAD(P)H-hydrate epimerase
VTSSAGVLLDQASAARLLPERDPRGHKGTFGRVVMVAGSLDYAGAALMAGAAALRAGSGLVTIALPASLQPSIAGRVPELITFGLPELAPYEVDAGEAAADVAELPADALLLGPGLKPGRGTTRLVQSLLSLEGAPSVVDASALGALSTLPGWWTRLVRPAILTPHAGEFARLGREVGESDRSRREAASGAARDWQVVVVLKGAYTVIAGPDGRTVTAPFEVPALASGGSGDVLAGVIASLLGQGLRPFEAAALGVYLHARAGELVTLELGDAGLMATDLLPLLPRIRRSLARGPDT